MGGEKGDSEDDGARVLLVVGGRDEPVISMNREAAARLHAPHQLSIVEGASHLFEEPGTLYEAARLAQGWFRQHLVGEVPEDRQRPRS